MDQAAVHPGETSDVRPGEELDVARLTAYLQDRLPGAGPLAVRQFPHGHSNLTYLLHWSGQEYVLRRPPFGNQVKTAHDMGRELRVLSHLAPAYAPAPRPYCYCDDPAVLGAPFYIMERRHGIVLRQQSPPGVSLDPDTVARLGRTLIEQLAALHAIDYRAIGLGDLGKPDGYVARQVGGWSERYRKSQTEAVPAMDQVADWLARNLQPDSGAALIHNDFKFDNLLLDAANPTHLVAVLDWEMSTVGDPLMDLGTSLGYWVQADDVDELRQTGMGPTALPGSLTRAELVAEYERRTGRQVTKPVFYYAYGLFKVAVIIQQIYARYARGHTHDERFARLNERVAVLAGEAVRAMSEGRL